MDIAASAGQSSSAPPPLIRCLPLPLPLVLRLMSTGSRNRSSMPNRLLYNCSIALIGLAAFRDGPVAFVLKNGDAVAFRCQGQFAFFDFYVFRLQNQLCRHEPFLQLILAAMTCCLRSSRSRR